jgi:murein DD-endopeptidase MepM/ murein hydrolase activator NlpD
MSSIKSKEQIIADTVQALTTREMRNDSAGLGHFGASRNAKGGGKRKHPGTDYEMEAGELVDSPVVGKVTKIGYTYTDDLSYRYIQITDIDGNNHRLFYVDPKEDIKVGSIVDKGTIIGASQDLSKKHGSEMKNHVHYEILDPNKVAIDQDTYKQRRVAGTSDSTSDGEV